MCTSWPISGENRDQPGVLAYGAGRFRAPYRGCARGLRVCPSRGARARSRRPRAAPPRRRRAGACSPRRTAARRSPLSRPHEAPLISSPPRSRAPPRRRPSPPRPRLPGSKAPGMMCPRSSLSPTKSASALTAAGLHGGVYLPRAHVERAAEHAREGEDVVYLVGIVAPPVPTM